MAFDFIFENSFIENLPKDSILDNFPRQVNNSCFSFVNPHIPSAPLLIHFSDEMLNELGLTPKEALTTEFLDYFSGKTIIPNTSPYAMCYGGHQFGHWAGQLGDGRAINLCKILYKNNQWALQIKGAGPTPYSRTADGYAVLRSSIREYLCSEAMHHLGVPTTRALSLALTGDEVLRDVMYNGNPAYEKGAIVSRAAQTFVRFGNFELLAARQDYKTLKQLVDYTIVTHYSDLGSPSKSTYLAFIKLVAQQTIHTVMHWQRVGFVHGVMNTDNMSILGLTIDYGPYGWVDGFDYGWTPNTTDSENKRYRFGNQLQIALWNILQLVNALSPLVDDIPALQHIIDDLSDEIPLAKLKMMRSKLGLFIENEGDGKLISDLEQNLQMTETDMTIFFRRLGAFAKAKLDGISIVKDAFYEPDSIAGKIKEDWINWFASYALRLQKETLTDTERQFKMNKVNPKYVLRNYMAQLAIDSAEKGDYSMIDELYTLLKNPYEEQPNKEHFFAKRPEWARHKVGCSMLSCSS